MNKIKVIAIVGPTASGKTSFSIDLAEKINGEIISADSRLVYKGFDIGTAKPTIAERHGLPHYMIDIVEPEEEYSAALWASEAEKIIDKIVLKNKIPIIVGGTGLYFRILLENYKLPQVAPNPELRTQLNSLTYKELDTRLRKTDKETADKIAINDKKKIIRAIEIVEAFDMPMEKLRGINIDSRYEVEWIGLNYERDELYKRINTRVDSMIEQGLIDETKFLLEKHGRIPNLTDTIGYREIISYLDGECDLKTARDSIKQNSRRFAKRQLTWFRKNHNIKWNVYPEKI